MSSESVGTEREERIRWRHRLPRQGPVLRHAFLVDRARGKRVERVVSMTDLENDESMDRLQVTLAKMGVTQALEEAGVKVGDLVRFGVFAALPFAGSPGHIVGLAAVAGLATGLFRPAALAGLPNLVSADDLADANSLLRVVEYFTTTAGTLLGGALAAAGGPHLAYWLNAGTFVVSALHISGAWQIASGTLPSVKYASVNICRRSARLMVRTICSTGE